MTEAEKRAKKKYNQKVEVLRLRLYPSEADIKEKLQERADNGETRTAYIKRLIRSDRE